MWNWLQILAIVQAFKKSDVLRAFIKVILRLIGAFILKLPLDPFYAILVGDSEFVLSSDFRSFLTLMKYVNYFIPLNFLLGLTTLWATFMLSYVTLIMFWKFFQRIINKV